eukprot:tig00020930_g16033.t1
MGSNSTFGLTAAEVQCTVNRLAVPSAVRRLRLVEDLFTPAERPRPGESASSHGAGPAASPGGDQEACGEPLAYLKLPPQLFCASDLDATALRGIEELEVCWMLKHTARSGDREWMRPPLFGSMAGVHEYAQSPLVPPLDDPAWVEALVSRLPAPQQLKAVRLESRALVRVRRPVLIAGSRVVMWPCRDAPLRRPYAHLALLESALERRASRPSRPGSAAGSAGAHGQLKFTRLGFNDPPAGPG